MKKLALIALLITTPAFAQEPPKPDTTAASEAQAPVKEAPPTPPAVTSAPTPPPGPTPAPPPPIAPQPVPAQPTAWNIEGLDANDIATLNDALESLPMRVYRQFTLRLQQKIKPVK